MACARSTEMLILNLTPMSKGWHSARLSCPKLPFWNCSTGQVLGHKNCQAMNNHRQPVNQIHRERLWGFDRFGNTEET